jgi:hypothetical protein
VDVIVFAGILVLVIAIELIFSVFFIFKKKNVTTSESDEEDSRKNNLLCRFVLDGTGKKIGESVAIDKDIMIVKTGSRYLGVPLKHVEEEEKTLLVKGLVDHGKAEEMGEKWRLNSLNKIDHDCEEDKDEKF